MIPTPGTPHESALPIRKWLCYDISLRHQADLSTAAGRPALLPLVPLVLLTPRFGSPLLRPSRSTQALQTSWLLM
jgi:hypothetical protein